MPSFRDVRLPVQLPCPGGTTRDAFVGVPAFDDQSTVPFTAPQHYCSSSASNHPSLGKAPDRTLGWGQAR
eukprot:16444262-Heterocapsa_arctica.AAC.1